MLFIYNSIEKGWNVKKRDDKYIFQKSKLLNSEYFGHYQKKNGLQDASHSGGFTIVIPTKEESYFKCLFHNSAFYLMIP